MFVGGGQQSASKWLFGAPQSTPVAPDSVAPVKFKVIPITVASMPATLTDSAMVTLPPADSKNTSEVGYRLGPQDILRVDVWGHPDLSTTQQASGGSAASPSSGRVVDENGQVFFPLVGVQPASGLTASQFRSNMARSLSKFIKDPQVEVSVVSYRSKRVLVAGEVRTPGVLPITDVPMRITDAIGSVGGPGVEADLSQALLARGGRNYVLNLNRIYFGGDAKMNIALENGDVLTIPDRLSRKVFVLGELTSPKSQQLRYGKVSLAEVISDSGGPNPISSNAGEIFVIRPDSSEEGAVVYKLDALDPTALILADRFEIRPRDIIYVNPTNLTRVGRVIAQLLPVLSSGSALRTLTGN